jgi:hypothetical protein
MVARTLFVFLLLIGVNGLAQVGPMLKGLPIGNQPVGFKIITITDPSRVTKPLFNYFGEKEKEDRARKIYVHIWYPAKPKPANNLVTYGDYAINDLYGSTNESISENLKTGKLTSQRSTFEGFFGKVSDEQWRKIISTPMLATKDAAFQKVQSPLLIGMLRPLSTAITNEMLASNGYVVAMVKHSASQYPLGYIEEIQDMRVAMKEISKLGIIDEEKIGAFGFSGSGFTQVAFAMADPRIRALADLESGFFMDGLFQQISASDFYSAQRLKIPFLHLFGTDASVEEKHISEFEKLRYADRYRVILNQKKLHHWDFATEGRASTTVVEIRGGKDQGIRSAYEIASHYLLEFFNSQLRNEKPVRDFFKKMPALQKYPDSLYSMQYLPKLTAPPDQDEFVSIINRQGIQAGLSIAREIWAKDTLAEILHENILNLLARQFLREEKKDTGLAMMKFAAELHPREAWIWNNLGSMQEDLGLKDDALISSEKAFELLSGYQGSELSFNERIKRSSAARIKRLKGL